MFKCYLNVKLCIFRIGGSKYLSKYIYKVNNRVTVQMVYSQRRYDEISVFEEARFVSASEAVWRLFHFGIVERHPTIIRLDVHLEDLQTVHFHENNKQGAINGKKRNIKITEWFAANER